MKNATLNRVAEEKQTNFFRKAIEFIMDFFNSIVSSNIYKSQLSQINNIIDEVFVQENLDPSNLNEVDFVLYSMDSRPSNDADLNLLRSINKQLLNSLKQSYSTIRRGGGS